MGKLIGLAVTVLVLFVPGCTIYGAYATDRTFTATVNEIEYRTSGNVSNGNGSIKTQYLLFTDAGVLENTDSLLRLKFNSSDIRAGLKKGETYCFHTHWWRAGFFSWYPNVLDFKPGTC